MVLRPIKLCPDFCLRGSSPELSGGGKSTGTRGLSLKGLQVGLPLKVKMRMGGTCRIQSQASFIHGRVTWGEDWQLQVALDRQLSVQLLDLFVDILDSLWVGVRFRCLMECLLTSLKLAFIKERPHCVLGLKTSLRLGPKKASRTSSTTINFHHVHWSLHYHPLVWLLDLHFMVDWLRGHWLDGKDSLLPHDIWEKGDCVF